VLSGKQLNYCQLTEEMSVLTAYVFSVFHKAQQRELAAMV